MRRIVGGIVRPARVGFRRVGLLELLGQVIRSVGDSALVLGQLLRVTPSLRATACGPLEPLEAFQLLDMFLDLLRLGLESIRAILAQQELQQILQILAGDFLAVESSCVLLLGQQGGDAVEL